MYNIDLSFLHSKELGDESDSVDRKFNQLYKDSLIDKICPNLNSEISCSDCKIHDFTFPDLDPRRILEVNCHGLLGHHFCEVSSEHDNGYIKDDLIIVKMDDCTEIATVDETGDIVKMRRQRLGMLGEELPEVLRKANQEDMQKFQTNMNDELKARPIFREKVERLELNMKLVDVHFQFDRKRLFFFYTSDGRVDFRELAKELASIFKTRIELRQIGVRDEAKRIGGIGACGREYCCSAFMSNFRRITTQIASDQNLNSNLSKLSGPCGKLKCCLSFELDSDEASN